MASIADLQCNTPNNNNYCVPGTVVAIRSDRRSFLLRDWHGTACTVRLESNVPKTLQMGDMCSLQAPMLEMDPENGQHVLNLDGIHHVQPWSDPTSVQDWNNLAKQAAPMAKAYCARSAWNTVPHIRRGMAVILTNLSKVSDANPIAAIWYAGVATVLDKTSTVAWICLLDTLIDKMGLRGTARRIVTEQLSGLKELSIDHEDRQRFRQLLQTYRRQLAVQDRKSFMMEDETHPHCWSQMLPQQPEDIVKFLPGLMISDIQPRKPETQGEFQALRNEAKVYFNKRDFVKAREILLAQWSGLQGMAARLSISSLLMAQTEPVAAYAVTSLVLDAIHNPGAWMYFSKQLQTAGQADTAVTIIQHLLNHRGITMSNQVLAYRKELHRLKESSLRSPTPIAYTPYIPQSGNHENPTNDMKSDTSLDLDMESHKIKKILPHWRSYITTLQGTPNCSKFVNLLHYLARRSVPRIHEEADLEISGIPSELLRSYLYRGYVIACSSPWLLATIIWSQHTLPDIEKHRVQRWNGPVRKHMADASHGSFQPGDVLPVTNAYSHQIRAMFVNCPTHPTAILGSPTHVSVGFNDLGELLSYGSPPLAEEQGVHFIGVDQSPFAVARSLVILEMLRQEELESDLIDCVLEVWYSTVWKKATLASFSRACESLLEKDHNSNNDSVLDSRVTTFLRHWLGATPIMAFESRTRWWRMLAELPDQGFTRYV